MQDAENEGTPLQSRRRKVLPNSNGDGGLVGRLGKCCCSALFSLALLALVNAISVAGIIIGSYYLDKAFCPGQPNLAPVLISSGALAIILSVFEGRTRMETESGESKGGNCALWTLNFLRLAKFCLFVYLCVLVFSLYSHLSTTEEGTESAGTAATTAATVSHYCHPTLFFFAFWTVLFVIVCGGAALFMACCFCCVAALFGNED